MTTARERLEELARTSGHRLLDDEHDVWTRCLVLIGQEMHAAVSRVLSGDGAAADAAPPPTVPAVPRPRRARAVVPGYVPTEAVVAAALTVEPQTAARIADTIGAVHGSAVDMRALAHTLRALCDSGAVVADGERRGKRYAIAPGGATEASEVAG